MITIEFYRDDDDENSFACVYWPTVPRVGESVNIGDESGIVTEVCWGTCVKGDGQLLLDQPCVSIILTNQFIQPTQERG